MAKAKYYLYRNLHTGGFSVKHRGRVVAHLTNFVAQDVTFKVNEAGRVRVLGERRKNVHAYLISEKPIHELNMPAQSTPDTWRRITYNPYRGNYFFYAESPNYKVESAGMVVGFKGSIYHVL